MTKHRALMSAHIRVPVTDKDVVARLQASVGRSQPHVCTRTCTIHNPRATVVVRKGVETVVFEWESPQPGDTMVRALCNLYVCTQSKTVHQCTPDCTVPKIMNSEHCLMCPISSLQWNGETEHTRSWRNLAKCMPTIATVKTDPNKFCRDANGLVLNESRNLTAQACKLHVKELFQHMFFSQVRKQSEFSKYIDGTLVGNKEINKYVRYCKHHHHPVNVSTMCTIYTNSVFAHYNYLRTMHRYRLDTLCALYTPLLFAYWHVLLPDLLFETFVPACLYLMRAGVLVGQQQIIARCSTLEHILPEANMLDLYGIRKTVFTQTKNNILSQIRRRDPIKLCRAIASVMSVTPVTVADACR